MSTIAWDDIMSWLAEKAMVFKDIDLGELARAKSLHIDMEAKSEFKSKFLKKQFKKAKAKSKRKSQAPSSEAKGIAQRAQSKELKMLSTRHHKTRKTGET